MKSLDEEGSIISSITVRFTADTMHHADDSSTIADDNDAADNNDDVSEPTAKRKRRRKKGQKIGPIRKGRRQGGTYTYKRVPTPDRKRNKTAVARVITEVDDTDNQKCGGQGLHLIGGRFVSCITL
jgi:hypothetical protein